MKVINLDKKIIHGIRIRTINTNEMNPKTAKIGALWQKFDKQVIVDYQSGEKVYGVYYDYESDANGEYSVLAGYDGEDENLEEVTIVSGKYLRFVASGEIPQVVIETWGKIWEYFSDETSEFKRAYKTDFEYYKSGNDIEIFISIR